MSIGGAESFSEYAQWLWKADILPVTSIHDFFGISVVEAIYCGCIPVLPERLAYPEHLKGSGARDYSYGDDLFKVRLSSICQMHDIGTLNDCRGEVFRYDWSNITTVYDDTFENLVHQNAVGRSTIRNFNSGILGAGSA